jgi:Fe-S cluster assembly iron-binding protein IscA
MMGRNAAGIPRVANITMIKAQPSGVFILTVTNTAKGKYREALKTEITDPEIAIRIIFSPSKPNQLELVFAKEKGGDHVVKTEEGRKVLLIGTDLMPGLEEVVIDDKETPEGTGFIISKPASSASCSKAE